MAYQVVWSPKAIEDVEEIASYIAKDSVAYAAAVVRKILDTTGKLRILGASSSRVRPISGKSANNRHFSSKASRKRLAAPKLNRTR
jgi:plasmid stabilization system protein ParE